MKNSHRFAACVAALLFGIILLREAGPACVLILLNLTPTAATADLFDPALAGEWHDVFSGERIEFPAGATFPLGAWAYRVLALNPEGKRLTS